MYVFKHFSYKNCFILSLIIFKLKKNENKLFHLIYFSYYTIISKKIQNI